MAGEVYALLVGIDRYKNASEIPHLRGCVADVQGTYSLLVNRFGLHPSHVRLLTSRRDESDSTEQLANRANILRGWREHLGKAGPGDHAFFHYSGHGSQARSVDPNEPDGYDETIVPFDSRTPGIYDILDKELAQLIHAVEQQGAQVTVFLDCCHSGSGTRLAATEMRAKVRRCHADERLRPTRSLLQGVHPRQRSSNGRSPSGWVPLGNHVLLAACRDEELCNEYLVPATGQWHGAATHYFLQALSAHHAVRTWSDVHDFVQTNVQAMYPLQTPQLEGRGQLELFGDMGKRIGDYLLVTEAENQQHVKVNGGAAVGMTVGSRIDIYPPASTFEHSPLTAATVEEVKVDHAWARLDQDTPVKLASRVKITGMGYTDQTRVVAVDDEFVRKEITAVRNGQPSPFLRSVRLGDTGTAVDFRVVTINGHYQIQDGAGLPLVQMTPAITHDGARQVALYLDHMAIYRSVQQLRNPDPSSAMHGALDIEAATYTRLGRGGRPADLQPVRGSGNEVIVRPEQRLLLTVRNRSETPICLAVMNLDADFGISRIYPIRASYQLVEAKASVPVRIAHLRKENRGRARNVYTLKVLATRTPVSFDVLQMPKLGQDRAHAPSRVAGNRIFNAMFAGLERPGLRDLVIDDDDTADNWTTAQIQVTFLADAQRQTLVRGQTAISLDPATGLLLRKPLDFQAELSLSSLDQAVRDSKRAARLPPGLTESAAAEYFQPILLGESTRTMGQSPLMLAIATDPEQLTSISADTPLEIELAVADEPDLQGIVPIVFDGEFHYVAGRPTTPSQIGDDPGDKRRMAVTIDFLPTPAGQKDEAGTRDLKRTVRLFLYKVFLRTLPDDTGLRQAELINGQAQYTAITGTEVRQAKRIALFIHGLFGDSRMLVERVWAWTRVEAQYDLCLTYDYESYSTGIKLNAEILAGSLEQLGLGEDDDLHLDIFAYNMGCEIARALVELLDGHRYTDRIFMAGAPNAGTPLAKGRALMPWIGDIFANLADSIPPVVMAHLILGRLVDSGDGIADLDPDSIFYQELNAAWRPPVDVPYYVQIGDNSSSYLDWSRMSSRAMKAIDTGLDTLFSGDNDMMVSVDSAIGLRERWPRLHHAVLSINHFRYFSSEEAKRVLSHWLAAPG